MTSGSEQLDQSITLETDPNLAPWRWYIGAIQQYQTALLLLAEVFAYPMRKEADRIWKALDFVFEPPLELTRDQKARLILTEIRDRMGVYQEKRKFKVPTGMLQRLGQTPSREKTDPKIKLPPMVTPGVRYPDSVDQGISASELVQPPTSAVPSLENNGTSPSSGSGRLSFEISPTDDLMDDIDWVRTLMSPLGD